MNFQQLRFVREAVRQNMNLTEVANVLYTSQSGVSKQIKDLEDELGVDIFIRRGKRLTGLTEPGKEVHQVIERMLLDAENLRRVARQFADQDNGQDKVPHVRPRLPSLGMDRASFEDGSLGKRFVLVQQSHRRVPRASLLIDGHC